MKSHNLTQISLRNDPINRQMQGFSFQIDEDENWSSRCDFFLLSRSKLDFKHSIDAEMHQEQQETSGTRNGWLNKEYLINNLGHVLRREERFLEKTKMSSAVRSDGLIAINDRYETSLHESSPSFVDRRIADVGSRCFHLF